MDRLRPHLTEWLKANPGMFDTVFWVGPVAQMPKRAGASVPESPSETYWDRWSKPYIEITSSLDRMNQSLVYLSEFPALPQYRFHRISEADWTQYHIEMYLHETYILHSRLLTLVRKVGKLTRCKCDAKATSKMQALEDVIESAFHNAIDTRGQHVHQARWSDDRIRDIGALAFIGPLIDARSFRTLRGIKYSEVLVTWKKSLAGSIRSAVALVNHVCEQVERCLRKHEPIR